MNETVSSDLVTTATPAPHTAGDPKRLKFEELATARTKRVIKAIRILANMGGRGRYRYSFSAADVGKIADAIDAEVKAMRQVMVAPGRQLDIEFDL